MVMVQFLAQTNVYWVEVPLHLWLDVSSDTAAKSPPGASGGGAQEATSSPTLQIAWV